MLHKCRALLTVLLVLPVCGRGENSDELMARATAAVAAAVPRAQADAGRPIFHVTAPAQWINDPNGPIFHKGFYHLFYQLHPFSDGSGPKYWGHVRSPDLAHWEHLPIALAPSGERGEAEVWSGCCAVNGAGQPVIFYTSIAAGKSALEHAEQWAATSDDDLLHWQKLPANPVLSEAAHGGTKIYDWRDPFIFQESGRTFMVLGGSLNRSEGGQAVVVIYEAANTGLTNWTYRGVLFQHPDKEARTAECPNFFRVGDRWVLLVSPYGRVQYFIGDFDPDTGRFQAQSRGLLDHGANYYAPNTMLIPDGRRLVWGWVKDFPGGRGWNGCLSLPRELSVTRDGELRQRPAPQLERLRGARVGWRNILLEDARRTLSLPATNALEILVEASLAATAQFELAIQGATPQQRVTVRYDGAELDLMGIKAPLLLPGRERNLQLRIFMDRSVLEVFANETVCLTKTIAPLDASDLKLELIAAGGPVRARKIQAWPMNTIW